MTVSVLGIAPPGAVRPSTKSLANPPNTASSVIQPWLRDVRGAQAAKNSGQSQPDDQDRHLFFVSLGGRVGGFFFHSSLGQVCEPFGFSFRPFRQLTTLLGIKPGFLVQPGVLPQWHLAGINGLRHASPFFHGPLGVVAWPFRKIEHFAGIVDMTDQGPGNEEQCNCNQGQRVS